MHHVLVMGGGKIGSLITYLLARSKQYSVHLADVNPNNTYISRLEKLCEFQKVTLDANNSEAISEYIKQNNIHAVISSLPYSCNVLIAQVALNNQIHYFDLTEDIETTRAVQALSQNAKSAFVPQCGLAPGFINIVANDLMRHFHELDTVKMRVGALPLNISNALQYSLTWSTDGLINEYGNLCRGIENRHDMLLLPLEGLEEINVDGLTYEAFNTSGGAGSLVDSYLGKVKNLNYKTIRYPGHCAKIKFLMNDLKLNEDRETLKLIFERAIPITYLDVVLVYVSVTGRQDGEFLEENYTKKFYSQVMDGQRWSAIQLTTASGICSVVDMVLKNPQKYHGFVRQEEFSFIDLIDNPFGRYYA